MIKWYGNDTPHGERSRATCRERNLHALHVFGPFRPRANRQDPPLASSSVPRKPSHQHVLQTRSPLPHSFPEGRLLEVARIRHREAVGAFIEFRKIGGHPKSITFCAFLNACSDGLLLNLGEQLHGLVFLSGLNRDVSVCNGLIDFYGKCKKIHRGETVFAEMGTRNTVSWCSLVAVYVQNHEDEKASLLFLRSRKEIVETCDFMISSALSVCAGNEDSEQAFDEMPEKNLVTKNSLISGYAHQGQVDMAVGII
ncbi:hypothetical protein Bca52824_010759 [Brassica carinata]|uniref:Pentatricopeptide repeat-containing protein n=1 Tax=Brassica carinata TaxID=52824 RepID=A0A8X7WEH0_BRACI|nr:hypothetical protein Bca52824_010759 [Brassica carinata]